jgi:hypothetical protein
MSEKAKLIIFVSRESSTMSLVDFFFFNYFLVYVSEEAVFVHFLNLKNVDKHRNIFTKILNQEIFRWHSPRPTYGSGSDKKGLDTSRNAGSRRF